MTYLVWLTNYAYIYLPFDYDVIEYTLQCRHRVSSVLTSVGWGMSDATNVTNVTNVVYVDN